MRNDSDNLLESNKEYPKRTPREIFGRFGFAPTPPSNLNEQQLPGRLWEFLYAAAGCRFFFRATNHLGDRDLYFLLCEKWFNEPAEDIPFEDDFDTVVMIADYDAGGMSHEEIFQKYYANSADRKPGHSSVAGSALPATLRPPFDRDRFLPWPHGLAAQSAPCAPCAPYDASPKAMPPTPAIPLPAPGKLSDASLGPALWTLLHNLALRGFYAQHTDHLSDRELYTALWEEGLLDPDQLPDCDKNTIIFHDFLGGWGEKETQIWLRYYASEVDRDSHAEDWPDDDMPPREEPPFKRDWRLPQRAL